MTDQVDNVCLTDPNYIEDYEAADGDTVLDATPVVPEVEQEQSYDLPINILARADVAPYQLDGHDVVALVLQAFSLETGQAHPFLVFIAPEDAIPLGNAIKSVAAPLRPTTSKKG